MPRKISSSSSEGEEDSHTTEAPVKQKNPEKTTTYQCPADFVSFCHKPCSSTLAGSLQEDDNELWLIKAPASFNPECFSGIKVPLSGFQTVKVPTAPGSAQTGSGQQIYSILGSHHGTSELHLLTSDERSSGDVVFGPAFSGLLNVCESYRDRDANHVPQVIPTALPPSIPPGLKQRFHPFGSKTPTLTCVAESEADGAALGPSSTTLRPLVVKRFVEETWQEEEGRKRKKKKKEKRIKTEELEVKLEPVAEVQEDEKIGIPFQQVHASEETRKKKKKRKDRERQERQEVEEGMEPSLPVKEEEEVTVKCEPVDDSYGDVVEGSGRRKKKKKKIKTGDD